MSDTTEPIIVPPATPLAVAAVHLSFFSRVKAEFTKIFKRTPSFTSVAAATMTFIVPAVNLLVAVECPAAAPTTALLLAKMQSAFAAASVVVKASGPTPTLISYLDSIRDNALQLEDAMQIKDDGTRLKVTTAVNLIVNELDALRQAADADAQAAA